MTASVRTALEALLAGESGSTRTLAAGRFHRCDAAGTLDQHPVDSIERAFEVVISAGLPHDGVNAFDPFQIRDHKVTIRVGYAVTNAGGDAVEAVSEQDGAGTLRAIQDRAQTDALDITTVLSWPDNRAGGDPKIVLLYPDGAPADPVIKGQIAIMELSFAMTTETTIPGSYAP